MLRRFFAKCFGNDQLRHDLEHARRELEASKAQVRQMYEVLASVHHDLGRPINNCRVTIFVLQDEMRSSTGLRQEMRARVNKTMAGVAHGLDEIESILAELAPVREAARRLDAMDDVPSPPNKA